MDDHYRDLPVDPDVEPDDAERDLAATVSFLRESRHAVAARWDLLLVIAMGGALGSLARWAAGRLAGETVFPWSTLAVNVVGGLALGALVVYVVECRPGSRYLRPFAGVGVLGGFTTFSTYMLDTRTLVADGHLPLAVLYLLGTLVAGLLAVWAGVALAWRLLVPAVREGAEEPS